MPNDSLHMEILTRDCLVSRPQLLKSIVNLVNGSYLENTMFIGQLRFENEQHLLSELGSEGLCAIILEVCANGDLKPVATVCTTPCIKIENESNDTSDKHHLAFPTDPNDDNFEIFAVSSLNSLWHRKKGLVQQCLEALEQRLCSQTHSNAKTGRLKLWVLVVEEINRDYWRRKGFDQIGESRICRKGMWGASKEFILLTMMKTAARKGD